MPDGCRYAKLEDENSRIKKAIHHFKYGVDCDIFSEPVTSYAKTAISALEKQIPKKPTPQVVKGGKRLIGNGWWCKGTTVYKCPCCNSWITQTYKYCIDCGQALDWGDGE